MNIIKVNNQTPDINLIKKVADVLKQGGLVVYPTDTAYGLGGNALDGTVIRKVYELMKRDFKKPTHVIVRDWKMIEKLCRTNEKAKKLYDEFLPGPLTIILPKKDAVPNILTEGLPTLGVRIPNNEITKLLSSQLPFPFTTPSANRENKPAPYSVEEVKKALDISKVDLVLDAGKLPPIPPSTMVDLSVDPLKILRRGPISTKEINEALSEEVT